MKFFKIVLLVLSLNFTSLLFASTDNNQSNIKKEVVVPAKLIEIRGLKHIDPDKIYEVLGVKIKPWFAFWQSDEKRIPVKLIPSIANNLRGYLDSIGYYDATFKIENLPNKVLITIKENKPVVIKDINISSDFPIKDYITFKKGDVFETEKFIAIKKKIAEALMKEGYCSYQLDSKAYIDLDKHSAILNYKLNKGGLCYFGNTTIVQKPKDIPDDVILSRMRYKPGDIFTTERVNDSYASLNQLGAFGQTVIDTDIKYFNVIQPRVSVSERHNPRIYTLLAGYDTLVGARFKADYHHYDFLGGGRVIGLTGEYSSELKKIEATFLQPALFKWHSYYFDLYGKGGYLQESYDTFDEKKSYTDWKLNYTDGIWSWDLGISLESIEIKKTSYDPSVIGGNFLLTSPYLRVIYDGRDSKVNPKNGYYFSGYFEYGIPLDEGSSQYTKSILEGRAIHTFGQLTLASVGKVGLLDDYAGELPASKLFYAGGSFSNRAYAEDDIGVTTSPTTYDSLGGKTWLNFTAEADYPIWGELYGAGFYDGTMISKDSYDFSAPWISSAGLGIRYITPVGPFKIDFATNIHDRTQHRLSFMIGQSF